jgi:hypothetical protein
MHDIFLLRRASVALIGAALAVFVVGLAAVATYDDDDGDEDRSALDTEQDEPTTTSTTARSTSTTGASGEDDDPSSSTSSSTVPTVPGKGSTTTTVRKATTTTSTTAAVPDELPEPGCASGGGGAAVPPSADWATRWQTMPRPNDPAKVSICIDDVTPKVGQVVTLTLVGSDDDAVIVNQECGYLISFEGGLGNLCRDALIISQQPRPTPPEVPGRVRVTTSYRYGSPGPRTVEGSVWSAEWHGYTDAYSSYAETSLTVDVHA